MSKAKRLLLFLSIGLLLGGLLIKQLPSWHFADDDFGAFWSGKNFCIQDIKAYFGHKTNDLTIVPTNDEQAPVSFFSSTYRPLTLLWYAFTCWLFDSQNEVKPFRFFQLGIWLHVLAGILLGWLLSFFCATWLAAIGMITFILFPCLGRQSSEIGRLTIQPFSLSLILLLIITGILLWAIKRRNTGLQFCIVLSSITPILMHELSLFFPCWLILISIAMQYQQTRNFKAALEQGLPVILAAITVLTGYLALRIIVLPVNLNQTAIFNPLALFYKLKFRLYDFASLITDLYGLTWLPSMSDSTNYMPWLACNLRPIIKLLAMAGISAFLWQLWRHTTEKPLVAILLLGALTLSWPSLVIGHQARYIYPGLAFFVAAICCAYQYLSTTTTWQNLLKLMLLGLLMHWGIVGIWCIGRYQNAFNTKQTQLATALTSLCHEENLFDRTLFFIGLPHELFPKYGLAQAVRIFGPQHQAQRKVIYENYLNVRFLKVHSHFKPLPQENSLVISLKLPVITLECTQPDKLWIWRQNAFNETIPCNIGKIILQQPLSQDPSKCAKISIQVDPCWLKNAAFITWDYEQQRLVEIRP